MATQACIVCRSEEFRMQYDAMADYEYGLPCPPLKIIRCAGCGLLRLEPMPKQDELASFYPKEDYANISSDKSGSRIRAALIAHYNRNMLKFYDSVIGPEANILDVGCSDGELIGLLSSYREGWDAMGVELTKEAVAAGRKLGRNIIHSVLETAELPEDYFDLVIMNHLIEHVPNPRELLEKTYRLLKLGGKIYIETPNSSCLDFRIFGKFWGGLHYPRHTYLFSPQTLEMLLASTHFSVKRVEQTLNIFGWALGLQNYIVSRWNIRTSKGRAWFYPFLMLFFLPVVMIQKAVGNTAAMGVIAEKV